MSDKDYSIVLVVVGRPREQSLHTIHEKMKKRVRSMIGATIAVTGQFISPGKQGAAIPRRATARVGILEESRWKRPGSRRGGGGVERGGDACIALGGSTLPQPGRCKHPHPAPTRLDASEDAVHGHA